MADGRNFRSFYYDTLGLKNVEQKKALEILLNSEEIGRLLGFLIDIFEYNMPNCSLPDSLTKRGSFLLDFNLKFFNLKP